MPLPSITEHDWDSVKINYGDTTAFITKFDQQQDWIQVFGEESNAVGEAIEEWVNNPVDVPISVEAGGDGITTFSIWHQWSKATAEIAGDKDEALSLIGAAGDDELAAITLEGSSRYDAITLAGSEAVDAIEAAGAFWNPANYYTSSEVDDIINDLDFGDGTVTSVSGTGTVAGLTLSGTVTTTGNITLGGTLSVNLTSMVTGDLPFSNLAQGSALSVLGVAGNSGADVASIAAGSDHQPLRRSGTTLGFGALALNQAAAVTGTLPVGNGGTGVTTSTGSGNNVLSTSPTLVTPILGTPTSGNLSNCTAYPVSGLGGAGTGVLTALGVNIGSAGAPVLFNGAGGTPSSMNLSNATADGTDAVGFRNIPQNSRSANYTLVLGDAGKHIYHPSADTTGRTWTIPANSGGGSVAFPIGTAITFINDNNAGTITIAITSDTLVMAGTGSTGSRTLAANGNATATKIGTTRWQITGVGLT